MKSLMGKNGLLLAAFAIVVTALLSATYVFTAPHIAQQQQRQLQQSLQAVLPAALFDNEVQNDCLLLTAPDALGSEQALPVYRARLNGEPSALAIETVAPNGYNGRILLLVGVDVRGVVTGVRTLEHQETPGLGDKIDLRIDDWITSFTGKTIKNPPDPRWAVQKDGGQFDQFTGATITPRAVVQAVYRTVKYANAQQEALFSATANCDGATAHE